jgi:hypothetical protein
MKGRKYMLVIEGVEKVSAGFMSLSKEPDSTHSISYVYKNGKEEFGLAANGENMSRVDLKSNKYTMRYAVSRKNYAYRHECEYASKDPGCSFNVSVQMNVSVNDAICAVQSGIIDIRDY